MTDGTDVPAGWYRDPLGGARLRWWDAKSWTEHIAQSDSSPQPPSATVADPRTDPGTAESEREPQVIILHPSSIGPTSRLTEELPTGSTTATKEPTRASTRAATEKANRSSFSDIALTAETWNSLNRAIANAVNSANEPLVELRFAGAPTLVIDPRGRAYWWADPGAELTKESPDGMVETVARPIGATQNEAGRDWEPLVWLIGAHAQPESFSPLSWSGARFKLRRWPNLTTLSHTSEQMTMTAMLSAAHLTVTELSSLAKVDLDDARRLISTFELMSLLTHTVDTIGDQERQPLAAEPANGSLFYRLKSRFSR